MPAKEDEYAMVKTVSILKNEDGSLMVLAIMFLVLLTIAGLAASNLSISEVQIATSELMCDHHICNSINEVNKRLIQLSSLPCKLH